MAESSRTLTTNIRTVGAEQAAASFGLIEKAQTELVAESRLTNAELSKQTVLLEKLIGSLNKSEGATKRARKAKKELSETAVNANGALIAFNRGIQDLPYGIIGITNNLQQFSEEFARVRQQSGSTKEALRGLLGSLTGVGGWLFAFSLATTVLQYFALNNRKTKEEVKAFSLETLVAKTRLELFEEGIANVNKELLKLTDSQLASKMGQLAGEIENITKQLATAIFLESSGQYGIIGNALFGSDPEELTNKLIELNAALDAAQKINTGNSSLVGKLDADIEAQNKIIKEQAKTEAEVKKAVQEKARLEKERERLLETEEDTQKRIKRELEEQAKIIRQIKQDERLMMPFDKQIERMRQARTELEALLDEFVKNNNEMRTRRVFSGAMSPVDLPVNPGIDESSLKKDIEKDFSFYKDLVESTADIMRIEFISAWEDIFGEANSLFEKLIQNFIEKLADLALQKAAASVFASIVDFFLPGAGSIINSATGAPAKQGGGTTVINVKVGDQTVQKVFLRHTPNAVKQAQFLRQL